MTRPRTRANARAGRALALSLALAIPALAAAALVAPEAAAEPTPIADLRAERLVEIEGTVGEVFGNRFTLRDATGATLVSTGPEWHRRIDVAPGEALRVIGEPDTGEFDAFRILRASGEEIVIRPVEGPPPWAGGPRRQGG